MGAQGRKALVMREFAKWARLGGDGKRKGKARRPGRQAFQRPRSPSLPRGQLWN